MIKKMSLKKSICLGWTILFSISCHSLSHDYKLYFNHSLLTTTSLCDHGHKCMVLNNGGIDSIVTHSSIELMSESPFTFIYLHSGKQIEIVGECIYYSNNAEQTFCILLPPCCANNTIEYNWWLYDFAIDTIKTICTISIFTPTDIWQTNIEWHSSPQEISVYGLQLRSTPNINDTEEDEELRQIGNVIWNTEPKDTCYELGFKKNDSQWKLCIVPTTTTSHPHYVIGWYLKE